MAGKFLGDSSGNGQYNLKPPKLDDEVYCTKCHEALKYDRENRQWRTKYLPERFTDTFRRCYFTRGIMLVVDHEPRMNTGRLIRAARRYNDKRSRGLL